MEVLHPCWGTLDPEECFLHILLFPKQSSTPHPSCVVWHGSQQSFSFSLKAPHDLIKYEAAGDGWLHFRETTPLRDPGLPRITNGFLIIFHHPILCLSLILPMIPETSRELHLNLSDQSRLRSSRSLTCLTALNSLCVHKACMCRDSRYSGAHLPLALSLPERPRSAAAHTHAGSATPSHSKLQKQKELEKVSHQRSHLQLLYQRVMREIRVQMVESVILQSWWAFPRSHGCRSHTWLLEDFPTLNLNRFIFSVCCHWDRMCKPCVVRAFYDEVDTFGSSRARQKVVPPC